MKRTKSSIELGDVVRRFGPIYIQNQGERLLPSHRKALQDIMACHTAEKGGHRYLCNDCGETFWIYHGCGNRSCPSCHTKKMREWIDQREEQMLGCRYFHIVVTVPESLRSAFLAHQKILYGLLMKTTSSAVMDLAHDPKFIGAKPGILTVLHTWKSDLGFHPHVHLLVSAGGVSDDGRNWIEPRHKKWLLPIRALSKLVRRRFRACLKESNPEVFAQIDNAVWKQGWNSFCKSYGKGAKAALNYLGRYVYRVAITNHRIVAMDNTHVSFRYKTSKEKRWQTMRLRGEEFLRRFVMHVLPRGFHKVRYYGLWHHRQRETRLRIRLLLAPHIDRPKLYEIPDTLSAIDDGSLLPVTEQNAPEKVSSLPTCPACQSRNVQLMDIRIHNNRSP